MRSCLPEMTVDSAGISALSGECADPVILQTARNYGFSLEGHIARQLTPAMCREYDLILTMEKNHIEAVTRMAMEARGKRFYSATGFSSSKLPTRTTGDVKYQI